MSETAFLTKSEDNFNHALCWSCSADASASHLCIPTYRVYFSQVHHNSDMFHQSLDFCARSEVATWLPQENQLRLVKFTEPVEKSGARAHLSNL